MKKKETEKKIIIIKILLAARLTIHRFLHLVEWPCQGGEGGEREEGGRGEGRNID